MLGWLLIGLVTIAYTYLCLRAKLAPVFQEAKEAKAEAHAAHIRTLEEIERRRRAKAEWLRKWERRDFERITRQVYREIMIQEGKWEEWE